MLQGTKIGELLDLRNELVGAEDHVELYDLMDACDSEKQADENLTKEVHQLLNVWMKIDPTESARYRVDLMRIVKQ